MKLSNDRLRLEYRSYFLTFLLLFSYFASSHAQVSSVDKLVERLSVKSPKIQNFEVQYTRSSELLLSNQAKYRLDLLTNGAQQFKRIEEVLRQYATDPASPVRHEQRHGTILLVDGNVRYEGQVDFVESFPLYEQPPTQVVCIAYQGTWTEYYRSAELTNRPNSQFKEAMVRNGTMDSVYLPFLLPRDQLLRIVKTMTNTVLSPDVEFEGKKWLRLQGLSLEPKFPAEYSMYFNSSDEPQRVVISNGGEILDYSLEFMNHPMLGSVLVHENLRQFNGGYELYRENWDFSDYDIVARASEKQFSFNIPPTTLVNEYRFDKPFTYHMRSRPPTKAELLKMSLDPKEVLKYERGDIVPGPKGSRWIILLILIRSE